MMLHVVMETRSHKNLIALQAMANTRYCLAIIMIGIINDNYNLFYELFFQTDYISKASIYV